MIVHFTKLLGAAPILPTQSYSGDAGWDLYTSGPVVVGHGFKDIHTDISIAMPKGVWGRITGRSSTIRKYGIQVQEGIIDNGYRGELYFGVWNMTDKPIEIPAGTRLAQIIFHHILPVEWVQAVELPPSERGGSGFGSSGR